MYADTVKCCLGNFQRKARDICLETDGILERILHITAENYSLHTFVPWGEGADVQRLLKIIEITKIYFTGRKI